MVAAVSVVGFSPIAQATTTVSEVNSYQFLDGVPPDIGNSLLNRTGYQVCYQTFCSVASSATLGTIWTAEHLTAAQIESARGADRSSLTFFPDPHIPSALSARLSDYTRTGYDKGHMAPWADNADRNTFSLADILPQNRDNNRRLWEGVEATVRTLATKYGEEYVVSGPIFQGGNIEKLRHRVAIPTGFYKAVYIPALHMEGAYIVRNAPGNWWMPVSIENLVEMTHTNPFPALPAEMAMQTPDLPPPNVHGRLIPAGDNTIPSRAIKGPSPFDPPEKQRAETDASGNWHSIDSASESDDEDGGAPVRRTRRAASPEKGLFSYIEGFGRE